MINRIEKKRKYTPYIFISVYRFKDGKKEKIDQQIEGPQISKFCFIQL